MSTDWKKDLANNTPQFGEEFTLQHWQLILSKIDSLLQAHTTSIVELLEGIKPKYTESDYDEGYVDGIPDAISAITIKEP